MTYAEFIDSPALNRPFTLPDLLLELSANGIGHTVCVEAASAGADGMREAVWLREQMSRTRLIAGAVLWAPVDRSDVVSYLDRLQALFGSLLVGIRRSFECEPDNFASSEAVVAGVRAVGRAGYPFDVVLHHSALPAACELIGRCPEVKFVLDHLGMPAIRAGELDPWRAHLEKMALLPNVVCKVSGLTAEADHERWKLTDLRPYLDHAVACFGWDRLLYGSDWPVNTISGGYAAWLGALREYLLEVSPENQAKFFGLNCRRVYRLPLPSTTSASQTVEALDDQSERVQSVSIN
jgi:L-fuconolactonase